MQEPLIINYEVMRKSGSYFRFFISVQTSQIFSQVIFHIIRRIRYVIQIKKEKEFFYE